MDLDQQLSITLSQEPKSWNETVQLRPRSLALDSASVRLPAATGTLIPATGVGAGAPISHSHAGTTAMSSAGHVTPPQNKIGGTRKRRPGSSRVTMAPIAFYRVSGVGVSAGHTSARRPAAHWWAGRIDKDGVTS